QFGLTCSFSLLPPSASPTATGGNMNVGVTASAAACSWNSSQVSSWISIVGSGTGKGTGSVTVKVDPNPTANSRTGTITIANQTFTVKQGGLGCTYTLSSPGTSLGSTGGTGTFDVTAPSGCAWTVDPGPNWVSVTSGGTGNGNGTVNLSIAANSTTS